MPDPLSRSLSKRLPGLTNAPEVTGFRGGASVDVVVAAALSPLL